MKLLLNYSVLEKPLIDRILQSATEMEVVIANSKEEALELMPGTDILFGHFPADLFARRNRLKWIQSFSAGMDNFLFPEVIESEVIVTGASGCYGGAAADTAFGLLLAFARGIYWRLRQPGVPIPFRLLELEGLTLGVLGLGGIGREMVQRGRGFQMQIIGIDPVASEAPEGVHELVRPELLDEVMPRLDVLMSACALTPQSFHIINESRLRRMKPSAYVINISRGPIIDEAALLRALREGWIAGAGLDVTEVEPLPADSELRRLDNVILTHHSAGSSQNRNRNLVDVFCENLRRYKRGQPLINVVEKKRGY